MSDDATGDKWTQFHDMHSGGGLKTQWAHIYVRGCEDVARLKFTAATGRDPDNVTCSCCGGDYSVTEYSSLEQATAYERHCRWDDATKRWVEEPEVAGRSMWRIPPPVTLLSDFVKLDDILVVE